ncbi:HPP family protein [Streptomyces sp. NPDC017993]|uniref:HPP family protein n=1 Tax=Streptomyces sp. NPDC017993 TaxID=3365027 RepID=UPI003788E448
MSLDHAPAPTTPAPIPAAPVPTDASGRPAVRPLAGRAPAPPPPATALYIVSAAAVVLLGLVGIGALVHEVVLIAPLAASAALVHSAPALPLSQPRSVIGGHLLCAGIGFGVLAACGSSPWAAAVAGSLALAATMIARTPHSPACATAVIVVLQSPEPLRFLALLVGACVLLVMAGYAASRARREAPAYPAYWW